MHRLVQAQIDLGAVVHNFRVARQLAAGREIWPVVKADAYGHGMEQVAGALTEADGFCVATLDEGLRLRAAAVPQPVLVLQGASSVESWRAAAEAGLTLGLHDRSQLALLERCAQQLSARSLEVWLKVDTGMRRLGLAPAEVADCRRRLEALAPVSRVGLMTHFACADVPGHPLTERQIREFRALVGQVQGPLSACNSAALLSGLTVPDRVARPGIMLYGASPFMDRSAAELGLRPAMRLVSSLLAVKDIAPGESVGYGAAWVARRPARIGLVGIGYGDGYPRHAGTGGGRPPVQVGVRGQLVPLCGRVSMDSLAIDLTDCPDAMSGDEVELWGTLPAVDAVAQALDTIGYELLSGLTARIPRVYGSN